MVEHLAPRPSFVSEFPAPTEANWRGLVEAVLKGASFEKKLVSRTTDDIAIAPLSMRRADAMPVFSSRGAAPWGIAVRVDHPDAVEANALALADLEGGADLLVLSQFGSPFARGFGLRSTSVESLERVLKGVHLDLIRIRLEAAPFAGAAFAHDLAMLANMRRLPGATLSVDFALSPLSDLASAPDRAAQWPDLSRDLSLTITGLKAAGFAGPFLSCDGRVFHDAGASEAQELAAVLAQGVAYLRAFEALGTAPSETAAMLSFTLAADQDQFLTMAKLRAFRRLWAEIETACGFSCLPPHLNVETSWRMMSRRDCATNLLRTTTAALAAGLGGADSIGILPHSAALGLADGEARRIARNTNLILMKESNLARMADPAAGAGAIEDLTDALCQKAWAAFQMIEAEVAGPLGGFPAAIANGSLSHSISEIRKKRFADIATRRIALTGINEFPDITEILPDVLMPAPEKSEIGAFAPMRLGTAFEALRDRADRLRPPPRVFLANLGRVADFTARTTFAKNAYEAGGIASIGNDGFAQADGSTDLATMAAAFRASGADFACLCSSDLFYAEEGIHAAIALRDAGCKAVHLAGRPGEQERALREAGISAFLVAGMDLVAFLTPLVETGFAKGRIA